MATAVAYAAAVAEGSAERDRSGAVPRAEISALDRSGLLGITVPAEHGGLGAGPDLPVEVVRRIAVADPALAQILQGHYLQIDVLQRHGTDRLRRRLFGDVLRGGRIVSALAERGGAHSQDLRTRLSPAERGMVLAGRKHYVTGGLTAEWLAVSARDEPGRLVVAYVRRDDPGVALDEDWDAMGQRATVSGSAVLDDVPVERDMVVDYGSAFERPQLLGARAQLVHASVQVGIARGALNDAVLFLRTRARPFFEAAVAGWAARAVDDPHVTRAVGRLATRVTAAERLLEWAAGELVRIGLEPADAEDAARGSLAVAQAKAFGSEVAVEVSSELFALCGASATDTRHGLDRHWRNARTHSVHDPVDWKYHHLGAHLLIGASPPNHGQI
jgi:SfnB family sulfur acquisition oxidoreductase